jgi:hypothetical protein
MRPLKFDEVDLKVAGYDEDQTINSMVDKNSKQMG